MNVQASRVIGKNCPEYDSFYFDSLCFQRWSYLGKQNTWSVYLVMAPEQRKFVGVGGHASHFVSAVMDDFGNLVKVES